MLSPNERHVIAVHESGHALVALALPDVDPVQKITIIPRGMGALGFTMQRPREDRYLTTRTELRHRLAVLFGGRTAERLVLGEISTGAADDIKRASEMARDMVMRFGMSDELGNVVFAEQRSQFLLNDIAQVSASEHTREQIDAAVAHLLGDAAALAEAVLTHHRADLDQAGRTAARARNADGEGHAGVAAVERMSVRRKDHRLNAAASQRSRSPDLRHRHAFGNPVPGTKSASAGFRAAPTPKISPMPRPRA